MKQILRERERDKERAVKWNHFFHGDISVVAAKNRKWFKRGNTDLQKGPKQNFKPCIKVLNNKVVLEKFAFNCVVEVESTELFLKDAKKT
jgi:hypothetical protein